MSSLRNFVVIVLLAGVLGVVYFAINKPPKSTENLDLAPPWTGSQGDLSKSGSPGEPISTGTSASAALPGFPAASALPGTSISNTLPPSVTLPAAPPVAGTPAAPYPSASPPISTNPAPPQPAAPPTAANQPPVSGTPSAAIDAPRTAAPSVSVPAVPTTSPVAGATPAPSGTIVLGQPAVAPQTVYPAASPGSPTSAPANSAAPSASIAAAPPSSPPAQPSPAAPGQPSLSEQFIAVMRAAKARLDAGQFCQAHQELSEYYSTGHLSADESRLLAELLDQLGGTVIYSREHLLEPPYRVQPGDTLDRIAASYNVTPELLAKINGIRNPRDLTPGQELKVVRGPFEAVISLSRYEMTIFVGGRYAGRFRIGVGRDRANLEGVFVVRDKKLRPIYYGPDRVVASDDPANPLGGRLLNLGTVTEPWGIHGTDNSKNIGTNEGRGTIALGQRDIDDVYDILSVGSRITVRR